MKPFASPAFVLAVWAVLGSGHLSAADEAKRYDLTARASEIDRRTKEHPEIGFIFEKDGKPQDLQHAAVDTRVPSQGKLVIWLMRHNKELFNRLSSYLVFIAIGVICTLGSFQRFSIHWFVCRATR